jgi:hypothetical protein
MLIKNIEIFEEINDIENDCLDAAVEFKNGSVYTVTLATIKFLLQEMDTENRNFVNSDGLVIIVRKLTQTIINETLEAYAEGDAFWLKLHESFHKISTPIIRDGFLIPVTSNDICLDYLKIIFNGRGSTCLRLFNKNLGII